MNRVHIQDYRVVGETLSRIDHSRALTVLLLFKYGEYDQIINLSFNPFDYNDFVSARDALFATEFLRKTDNLPTSVDKKSVALKAFQSADAVCSESNRRLADSVGPDSYYRFGRKIASMFSDFDGEEFLELSGWGPGVTLTLRGRNAHLFNKFNHDGELTPLCNDFIQPWFSKAFPSWKIKPRVFEGNRVITVPKNAKTDRVIAVEPSLNLFFQKGVGGMIRKRLRRFGIDLNDQRHNNRLARLGSKFDRLATIDFSQASDTICYRLVLDNIPWKWFVIMDKLRSPRGVLGDSIFEYEKFSSMGNGFTFELESAIFLAAALAVVEEDHPDRQSVSVYGDDVIIPSDRVDEFTRLCDYLGFKINPHKSYSRGYYRESCGKHYWNGVDITPVYLRSLPTGRKLELYKVHNALVRYSMSICDGYHRDKRFLAVTNFIRSLVRGQKIPDGVGDGGFIVPFDEAVPTRNRRYQAGYNIRHLCFVPSRIHWVSHAVLLTRLYSPSTERSYGNELPEPRAGRYIMQNMYIPSWSAMGPWI